MNTIEIYAGTRGRAPCKGCKVTIEWAEVVATGRKMCFDRVVVLSARHAGGRPIEVVDLSKNHWATCPNRNQFKTRKAAEQMTLPDAHRAARAEAQRTGKTYRVFRLPAWPPAVYGASALTLPSEAEVLATYPDVKAEAVAPAVVPQPGLF